MRHLQLRVEFGTAGLGEDPRDVTVTVQHPVGQQYPQLADRLGSAVREATGEPVAVSVDFEERSRSNPPTSVDDSQ
ncbi:hypothetical protein [Haloferax sp. YSMS24]|uniref:hypothetical protein n=1 Tax=Haloferax sp. YSMS24 TaxID=3388425 RepID=UPI00398D1E36